VIEVGQGCIELPGGNKNQAAEAVERKERGFEPKCRVDFLPEDASNALITDSALPSTLLS